MVINIKSSVWYRSIELNPPLCPWQCSFVLTIGHWERHFIKVFCVAGCQKALRGLERGKERGFRYQGHAVTMATPHSTFLQPLVNKGAFEKVFIWTKSKHGTHWVYEFSLDSGGGQSGFHPEGRAGQRCAKWAEPFLVGLTEACC